LSLPLSALSKIRCRPTGEVNLKTQLAARRAAIADIQRNFDVAECDASVVAF
jgi:hypothetical protein